MDLIETVEDFVKPHLPEPFELVAVEWEKMGGDFVLSILVDKPEGVSIEDTADLSEIISPLLDTMSPDPFPAEGYLLEVASPGAERPLRKAADFEKAVGEYILVKLYAKIEGEKEFAGDLLDVKDGLLTLDVLIKTRHKQIEIPLDKVSKANTLVKL